MLPSTLIWESVRKGSSKREEREVEEEKEQEEDSNFFRLSATTSPGKCELFRNPSS